MARHDHNHLQVPETDHIQHRNGPHHEAVPLVSGQKLIVQTGSDAPLCIGSSGHGSMSTRSNGLLSSGQVAHYPGHIVGNQGTSHVSFAPYPNASSSGQLPYGAQAHPEVASSYPQKPEEHFAAMSSHADNRRASTKRKNPAIHPMDGRNSGDHYVGSSSSNPFSNFVQPNPTALVSHKKTPTLVTEPLQPQMPASIGPSNWYDHQPVNQGGSQRNVRPCHGRANISLEPRPASTYQSSNVHLLPFHSTASAFVSTSAERNQQPFSVPTMTAPSGITGTVSTVRQYHPSMHSSTSSVPTAPSAHGSSDSAIFANGAYVPRAVHGQAVRSNIHPSFVASSSSEVIPRETVISNYPPATSTAMRINQSSPVGASASSRQARHVSIRHPGSARNRRARSSSFYGFHPMMVEAQRFMMLNQLAMYESRQLVADPHRDLRMDIDAMGYEELLALGDHIGTVNTGLADEKISGCVKEVVCCSSEQTQKDDDGDNDGRCVVCLEEYKDNDSLGVLKCDHDFHSDCIKKWLQVKNACPVCKSAAL